MMTVISVVCGLAVRDVTIGLHRSSYSSAINISLVCDALSRYRKKAVTSSPSPLELGRGLSGPHFFSNIRPPKLKKHERESCAPIFQMLPTGVDASPRYIATCNAIKICRSVELKKYCGKCTTIFRRFATNCADEIFLRIIF